MKNIFLKSTFILLIGGLFTKVISFIIKVYYTRLVSSYSISLLAIINSVYSLLLTLANFNINTSISKRISSNSKVKKTIFNSLFIMIIINIILIVIGLLSSKYISYELLKNKDTYYPILCIFITLPFISIGYIIKGYFYGKQNVLPHMISNVLEQVFRFIIFIILLPRVIIYGNIITVCFLILINILTESFSILILYLFLPKKFNINRCDLKIDHNEINALLNISVPSISGRLLCNIGYFFEPIIVTNIMLSKGFDLNFITIEYGIYHSYVISLLLFPSFFISAIVNSLLPELSKLKSNGNMKLFKRRMNQGLGISFIIGLIFTIFIYVFREELLMILFNTNMGLDYLKVICPLFIFYYLEGPLSIILVALDKVIISSVISILGMIVKLVSLIIFLLLDFGIYSLIYSEILNIIFVIVVNFIILKLFVFNNK